MKTKEESYAVVTMRGHLAANVDFVDRNMKGKAVTFPLAVTRKGMDREWVDYHKIVIEGKKASEYVEELKKGDYVVIEGSLRNAAYEDKDGCKHFRTEILVKNISLIII